MSSLTFKDLIYELNGCDGLDFIKILNIVEKEGIKVTLCDINGCLGLTTFYGIYLNVNLLGDIKNYTYLYFLILHEIAHYKKIVKDGKEYHLRMMSSESLEDYCNHMLEQEIFADKWGAITFKKLTGKELPKGMKQDIHLSDYRDKLIDDYKEYYNIIKNDEENYKRIINSMLN